MKILNYKPSELEWTISKALHARANQKVIVVLPNHKNIQQWLHWSEDHFVGEKSQHISVGIFPTLSLWGEDRYIIQKSHQLQRIFSLCSLEQKNKPTLIFTTFEALFSHTPKADFFAKHQIFLETAQNIDQDDLIKTLKTLGYKESYQADEETSFAVRGSVFDIFTSENQNPLRLNFSGDAIETIRIFDRETQKSHKKVNQALITPATDWIIQEEDRAKVAQHVFSKLSELAVHQEEKENLANAILNGYYSQSLEMIKPLFQDFKSHILEFTGPDDLVFFPTGFEKHVHSYKDYFDQTVEKFESDQKEGKISLHPKLHFIAPEEISLKFYESKFVVNDLLQVGEKFSQHPVALTEEHKKNLEDHNYYLLYANEIQKERFTAVLSHQQDRFKDIQADPSSLPKDEKNNIFLMPGFLSDEIYLDEKNAFVIPFHTYFNQKLKRNIHAKKNLKNLINSFKDIQKGDYVIHVHYGLGQYQGMESIVIEKYTTECIKILYADDDQIFLPIDKLSLLQKYSSEESGHSLDKLGSQNWEKKKSKAQKAAKDLAEKLLKVHAMRELSKPIMFSPPNDIYHQFENDFIYDETDDQLRVISEVQDDLSSYKLMDRLVCGDVGFGKTEIALRATMRALQDNFQVIIIVPTTVLCFQHYRTFYARFHKYGAEVAQLNRFIHKAEAEQTFEKFSQGKIDILIGTHRLFSQKLKAHQLGLLIVDEEQKFGVTHKEKIKEMKAGSNILTLSATPIPRTLHMSMIGLKDISIISTAPQSRLSVKTLVSDIDEELIRKSITRELERGGQVFYVYNKVEDIEDKLSWLHKIVPQARIRFGHGQMGDEALENVIIDFLEQKFDVFLCTTIIESGIDMPRVNTLIVHHAEKFGLSQLYQLRGRVGRSSTQAYAYFLVKSMNELTHDAQRRLEAIIQNQDLGSGFQIASYDLEIRGAGNLVGAEQSGHMSAVGLDLYTEMLAKEVEALRGGITEETPEPEIKFTVHAFIPKEQIPEEKIRLQYYKSIFNAKSLEDLYQVKDIFHDQFEEFSPEVVNLFYISEIKIYLRKLHANYISYLKDSGVFIIQLHKVTEQIAAKLIEVASQRSDLFRITPDYKLQILLQYKEHDKSLESLKNTLRELTVDFV